MKFEAARLQQLLMKEVSKYVLDHGFNSKPVRQEFRKETHFGRVALHLSFIRHECDFDATADVAIRFDALENLVYQGSNQQSGRARQVTYSLGAELGNLHEGRQQRWTVAQESDVEAAAKSIIEYFEMVGLPYIERLSDIGNALDLLSGDDRMARLSSPLDSERAKRALALAFLHGQPERFKHIADSKTEWLTKMDDYGLEDFLQFRMKLEKQL